MKLMVFGSANIDHVYQLPHFVRAGETLASISYARNAGGKGFNQALALAKAGQEVCFAGAIGQDGLFLKDMLLSLGVHVDDLLILDSPTGHAIIQVDAAGSNSIILHGGANHCITSEMIDQALMQLVPGDWLLMQNEISNGHLLLQKAAEKGVHVALNPSPMSKEVLSWPLHLVDLFLLNEVEGADMTGVSEPDFMIQELLRRFPKARIVLTLGGAGSMYADEHHCCKQGIVPVKAIDTTAAGDTFTGYFLQGMMNGDAPSQCLETAAIASAMAVSKPGAGSSIPSMHEVHAWRKEHPEMA